MTAEIAIINRSAVTLAADSAMTMSVAGQRKIYTSTDKIFELSISDPVALMIYNNLEFMGAPLDVVIKQFRSSSSCCSFDKLGDAPKAFFDYLESKWMPSDAIQKRHARDLLAPVYSNLWDLVWSEIGTPFERSRKTGARKAGQRSNLQILIDHVSKAVEEFQALEVAECFSNMDVESIIEFYADVLDEITDRTFLSPPLDDDQRHICRQLGALSLHRNTYSSLMSGFVFAGFGKSDIFPSILHYETDGIIIGKFKYRLFENVETGRDQISAKVVPFAQRDVVDRFLGGIDPQLQDGVAEYLKTILERTSSAVLDGVKGVPRRAREEIEANISESLGTMVKDFSPWIQKIKEAYSKETEDMILFMAKSEAAHLAESLVNITSLKRKYSAGEESVAGPIDVAVISKSDGFVWVKRKHYFSAELNPRFFVRKFGSVELSKGGRDAKET